MNLLKKHLTIWRGIRAWGREIVLPVEKIKNLIKVNLFDKYSIHGVIDFGAGTLYWSKWFQRIVGEENLYPVDVIFENEVPVTKMKCFSKIDDIPEKLNYPVLFFICDVIHHLSDREWSHIKEIAYDKCTFIVIKDINCRFRFKNWMNKMHDRIINKEIIHDVDPEQLICDLNNHGFQCLYKDIHKLWYSHFIIIAQKLS